jgi:uncharacterized protein YbcV (DUF1398 family)
MFSIAQIKEAYSKVKSGADFPAYIQDLIELGVHGYDIFINDDHEEYFGVDNYRVAATKTYGTIAIAPSANKERFIGFLVIHQDGQTDYQTFCNQAAIFGITKWSVNIIDMTCTYFDSSEALLLIEKIPN